MVARERLQKFIHTSLSEGAKARAKLAGERATWQWQSAPAKFGERVGGTESGAGLEAGENRVERRNGRRSGEAVGRCVDRAIENRVADTGVPHGTDPCNV
jgi:hypothetical protein